MKRKLILYCCCFFLVINFAHAQRGFSNENPATQCGASDAMNAFLQKNPFYKNIDLQIEQQLLQFNRSAQRPSGIQAIVPLPVVVHIIHNNGPENISDAQVLLGIQHLNEAFANSGYYDPASGVNTNIQFCMAQRDPNGNSTNGITRNVSAYTNMSGPDYYSDDLHVKDVNRWNPLCYINIWLVKDIPGAVAGYAYLPSAHGSAVDGVIEEAAYFGSSNSNDVVIIHEIGHYLGLYHTFEQGCSNADCVTDGDKVCDTPPDNSTAYTSCNVHVNSCSSDVQSGFSTDQNDLTEDYMDYGNWDCMSIFTQGQSDRMNWFITYVRNSLLNCKSCLPPCTTPVTANFTSSAINVIVGTTVNFTNTSVNGLTYKWYIDEVFQSGSINFSNSFTNPGLYTIRLVAEGNNTTLCDSSVKTTAVVVTCPVHADFTASAVEIPIGQTIDFTNTTTGSPSFTNWLINNVQVSNAINFSNQFNVPGSYTITLSTGTGICTSVRNMIINVVEPCVASVYFEKAISTSTFAFVPFHTIVAKDSGIVIAGGSAVISPEGKECATIWKLSKNGNILWIKQFKSLYNTGFEKIIQCYDGNFIALGEIQLIPSQQTQILVAKIAANGSVIWQKVYSNGVTDYLNAFNYSLIETPAHDIVLGVTLQSTAVFANNVLLKLDPSGNILWSKELLPGASVYVTDMAIKNDKLYLGLSGMFTQYSGGFAKVNLSNGNIMLSKKYSMTAPVSTDILGIKNLSFVNDELRLSGTITGTNSSADSGSHLIMNVDTIGTIQSAKRIRLTDPTLLAPNIFISMNGAILRNGEFVFLESELFGSDQNFLHHTDLTYSNFTTKKISSAIFQSYTITERGNNNIIITSSAGNGISNKINVFSSDYSGFISSNCPLTPSTSSNYGATFLNADFPELVLQHMPFAVVPNTILYDSTVQMDMENICGVNNSSSCYSIKINTPDTLCIAQDSVLISCNRNAGCTERINWSVTSPADNSFVQVNDTTIKIAFPAFGNYAVAASIGSCNLVNDTANIFVTNKAAHLSLGPDKNLCTSSTMILSAGAGYKTYHWYDGSTDSTNTTYQPGTYFVTVEDYCNNVKSDTIRIMQAPAVPFELGPDTVRCNNDILTLTAPTGFTNYTWAPNYNINTTSGQVVQVKPLQDTVYTVTALLNSGCLVLDSIKVSVKQSPQIHLGNDTVYCRDTSIQLVAAPGFNAYLWNTNAATSMINVNASGIYSIAATWNNGCISKDTIQISIGQPDNFILPSIGICTGEPTTIRALSVYDIYLWSTGSTNDSLVITQPGNYWLQVSDSSGCTAKENFIAIEKDCIKAVYFPTAFSPNGDNVNDVFRPKVYGELEYFKMQLYNRFGEKLFETSDWNVGWDGRYKGSKQNIGNYIWFAVYKLKNVAEEAQKGSVLLLQ